jgi:preprotein translocase subunit SecA
MSIKDRKLAYACDVTYVTAKEAGFDYLRGFLCLDPGELVHRPFHFAIVDEADSILIDEARVPLVIAGDLGETGPGLARLARLVCELRPGIDYDTDEYGRNVNLTELGSQRAEESLRIDNLYAPENLTLLAAIRNALHAEVLLRRDVDYIVRRGRIELVDELTGRVADKRQWPDGLQAAIEAKEGLQLQPEGRVLGSVTVQHFLHSYPRLCGMTATAQPAAEEFQEFYGLNVTVIPTNEPCIRVDHPDLIFSHQEAKRAALIAEIQKVHGTGRPVLVGTASVAESDQLAGELRRIGVQCQVLNAKNDELEAQIVAEAGALGGVTISTNMAGRGTDVRLGGRCEASREAVVALGGLYVIGTNRHESRRVDDQLRGRAGRQGDPGSSRFFVSLEDDLIQRFGIRDLIPPGCLPARQGGPIDDRVLKREIARAQRIIDGQSFDTRKTLWKYSNIIELQRRFIQDWRQEILFGRMETELLAQRCLDRYQQISSMVGETVLKGIERRLSLLSIDRCWSDYLAEIARIRDGIHLVSLGGKEPLDEFHNQAREAFAELLERIDREIVATFESVEITKDGVDWEAEGLLGPSSTWTYLVTDKPFVTGPLAVLANRASIGAPLAWLYAPLWIAWMAFRRWQMGRERTVRSKEP